MKRLTIPLLLVLSSLSWSQNPTENLPLSLEKSIKEMELHDKNYIKEKGSSFFKKISGGQTPLFTLVACSDSRVQSTIFDEHPEGELFTIRNIGNQLRTTLGSIDYGILQLHTKILLIIGHSQCGAIDAIRSGHKELGSEILKELKTIKINKADSEINNVKQNVNNQVHFALERYAQKIQNHEVWVIGAIYDFENAMHQGAGDLIIMNINGETRLSKLKEIMRE